ncbi:hypothetical protein F2P81_017644 [Scophthalmus maximus]|uniref:Uncharacterized protein n=1 Tax=Scophthalmus maximus TaxID=52904 RepID=A0A6A4S9I4_SCOMX|nr:hypothetical protein F2P81_017644 [Scophthalmus maximus]
MAGSAAAGRAGPGLWASALLLVLLTGLSGPVRAVSEPGKWMLNVDSETLKKQTFFFFTKTLFNSSFIRFKASRREVVGHDEEEEEGRAASKTKGRRTREGRRFG